MTKTKSFRDELVASIGSENIVLDGSSIQKVLRDNSWLSPILSKHIDQLKLEAGKALRVDAVISPMDVDQLRTVISLAVRHNVAMTIRGGGTSNFGQMIPLHGGLVIDIRLLNRILEITADSITVEAGALQGEIEAKARTHGQELTVLSTTYASATAAGWVAGGQAGLGANSYGTIWDGNVLKVKLLTAEDPPRELTLADDELLPVLHTYGTTGVITEVTFPLVEARAWLEAVAVFDSFDNAVHFTSAMACESPLAQRVIAAQEPLASLSFTPLRPLFEAGQAIVLMIIDATMADRFRALCESHRGTFRVWKTPGDAEQISLALMVYGHRMLWIKKLAPNAAFLHVYLSPDHYFSQLQAIKERFGSDVWLELKYKKSRWLRRLRGLSGDDPLPAPVLTLVPGDKAFLKTVMSFCDSIGVTYMNPHTFLLEESGLFPDFQPIADFKRQTDPKGLLNPGKIGAKFFKPEALEA